MSLLIKNWSTDDWKELLKWAKIGANNAMIGEFAEVEELPPHGRLIDADAILGKINAIIYAHPDEADLYEEDAVIVRDWLRSEPAIIEADHFRDNTKMVEANAPTIIEAEEEREQDDKL